MEANEINSAQIIIGSRLVADVVIRVFIWMIEGCGWHKGNVKIIAKMFVIYQTIA